MNTGTKIVEVDGVQFELSSNGKEIIKCLSKDVKEITSFPEGVETIGKEAFFSCFMLTEVKLPATLKSIGAFSFLSSGLSKVEIPEGVETIEAGAFASCFGLSGVKLPSTLKSIGDAAFAACNKLNEIKLPSTLKSIGKEAFASTGLSNVEISEGVETIGEGAFSYCFDLSEIKLPSTLKTIGKDVFASTGLSNVEISEGVETIGDAAFAACNNLNEIKLPSTLKTIGKDVFASTGLSKVDIPEGVEIIEDGAFSYCLKLNEVKLPSTLKTIGKDVFASTGLSNVEISEGVETIGDRAFSGCHYLNEIKLPSTLKSIGKRAFEYLGLSKVDIPEGVETIEDRAFSACHVLNEIKLPSTLKSIGVYSFSETPLSNVVISEGTETIGDGAFTHCDSLYEIKLPSTLKSIGKRAFEGSGLSRVDIPEGVETIGDEAFSYCCNLTEIKLPSTLKFIGDNAFGDIFTATSGVVIECGDIRLALKDENVYLFLDVPEEFNYCYSALLRVIEQTDNSELYTKVLKNFDKDNFVNNVCCFVNNGKNVVDFCNSVIKEGNFGLLSVSIETALENYNYLVKQKILSPDVMNKLYFPGASGNDARELLEDYIKKNNSVPELFKTLLVESNDKNQLELRDRLVYVSTMNLIDDNFGYKFQEAIDKLKYSVVENVINMDKKMFIDSGVYPILESKYPAMCGIMHSLKDKLMGIDELWFNSLIKQIKKGGLDTDFDNFYKSLTVVKNWESYNEVERLTLLKNEIVGRLLFADICLSYEKNDSSFDGLQKMRKKRPQSMESLLKFASKNRDDLFFGEKTVLKKFPSKEVTKKLEPKIGHILTMLKLDPYSFDALRIPPNESKSLKNKYQGLQCFFASFANEYGYMFSKDETLAFLSSIDEELLDKTLSKFNDYESIILDDKKSKEKDKIKLKGNVSRILEDRLLAMNGQKTFSEFISNVVCTARIPKEMESKYLDYVRGLSFSFLKDKSDEELFKFCTSLDLYLRSKSEYEIQNANNDLVCAAKNVFDRDYDMSSDARILYSLYNLNRLAHDAVEIDLKSTLDHKNRLAPSVANDTYKKLTKIISAYNNLFHMGFSYDDVNRLSQKNDESIWFGLDKIIEIDKINKEIGDQSKQKNKVINSETFDGMAGILLSKLKVKLALKNMGMFLNDRLSLKGRKSLATFRYEMDDENKDINYENIRFIKKELSKIRDTFDENGNDKLSEEEIELVEGSVKAKSYFFESKRLFAQEIMNRMAQSFSGDFVDIFDASEDEKVNFYAQNGYVVEIQQDEFGQDVLVCLCDKFNEPFGIHLKDMPKSVVKKLENCSYSKTIAYAKLDRRGLTLRQDDFEDKMENMTSYTEFVGFKDYDYLDSAIKSNYEKYDVPAKAIRAKGVGSSSLELSAMLDESIGNSDFTTVTQGKKTN